MSRQAHFLLISNSPDYFAQKLRDILTPFGCLNLGKEDGAIKLILKTNYKLIIIDSSTTKNVFLLVSRIRSQKPDSRIIVTTASPTWTRAREAFRAGAIDYIKKTYSATEIQLIVLNSLQKTPQPWP